MARTILNQSTQVGASLTYLSSATAGSTLQSGALTAQDDLNALRVQVARLLDSTQSGSWYDDVATVNGQKRSVLQLSTSLSAIESKTILAMASLPASITIPTGQNYVVLTVANSQTPTQVAAIGASTLGTVVAQSAYSGAAFACSEMALVSGSNAQSPKNRCLVVDATTKAVIETSDNDVFGLMQVESTGTDGASFNDTTSGCRIKISFVYFNATTNAVVAAAASDVGGRSIRYDYDFRTTFGMLNEDAFLSPNFVDSVAAVDVTLVRATTNQAGAPIPVNTDVLWRTGNGVNWKIQNNSGSKDLFSILPSSSGNTGIIATDTFAFNTTSAITSVKGASVGTAAQAINVGVTAGQIDSAGILAIKSTGSNALNLVAGAAMTLTDGFEAASTWVSGPVPLAASSSEWSAYKTQFGELSLLAGIVKAGQMGSHGIYTAYVTATSIAAGATVTGNGSGANLNVAFPDSSKITSASAFKAYVNGSLMTRGDDYALVTGSTSTDLTFTFMLKGGTQPDRITIEVFGNAAEIGS